VLWRPAFFGIRPELVVKGGFIAWAQMGDPNASIPTPQPSYMRPMFGSFGRATGATSIAFVSQRAVGEGHITALGLAKRINAVRRCRDLTKHDMKLNDALPKMKVDAETYEVFADGVLLRAKPATRVALSRLYSLF
jgi:urease subunit alpha